MSILGNFFSCLFFVLISAVALVMAVCFVLVLIQICFEMVKEIKELKHSLLESRKNKKSQKENKK